MAFQAALADALPVPFTASAAAMAALRDLGRTEDVKFSPDNRRLAVAGYTKDKIVVFDVEVADAGAGRRVALTDAVEVRSPSLHQPHGLAFVDNDIVVVANREGEAPLLRLPACGDDKSFTLDPLQTIRSDRSHRLESPGSVSVSRIDDSLLELLICNNYAHHVTRHVLEQNASYASRSNEILLKRGLRVPDGVAVNADRRWIAISNHYAHSVWLYENTRELGTRSKPVGVLRNLNFPHGLRFTPDDEFLLVADAGAPCVNVYAKDGESWTGTRDPVCSLRVMDDATYRKGRFNPEEGGPKDLDIDKTRTVLVTTSEHQPLAFFDLADILERREPAPDWRRKAFHRRVDCTIANFRHLLRWIRNIPARVSEIAARSP